MIVKVIPNLAVRLWPLSPLKAGRLHDTIAVEQPHPRWGVHAEVQSGLVSTYSVDKLSILPVTAKISRSEPRCASLYEEL